MFLPLLNLLLLGLGFAPFASAAEPVVISAISPESGSLRGGTRIRVYAEGLPKDPRVYVGGLECTEPEARDHAWVDCTTPPHVAGPAYISIQLKSGELYASDKAFHYQSQVEVPSHLAIIQGGSFTVHASGGKPPYVFSILSGPGSIDGKSGVFKSDVIGAGTLQVKDRSGDAAIASFQVHPMLGIFPESPEVRVLESIRIAPIGGVPPYRTSLQSGSGTILQDPLFFIAPETPGSTVIKITDSLGNSREFQVVIHGVEFKFHRIAVGSEHSCVVEDGQVYCWGNNSSGQLGTGTNKSSTIPVKVPGLEHVFAISAGLHHTCALDSKSLKCWGNNQYGQLGDGTKVNRNAPIEVVGFVHRIQAFSTGDFHTCAISALRVFCWGRNDQGQLGNGTKKDSPFAVLAAGLGHEGSITAVSAGFTHTCAVEKGIAKCWGQNLSGQLGSGNRKDSPIPAPVQNLGKGVQDIAAGWAHTCASVFGSAKCWGFNGIGSLGQGSDSDRSLPVDVLALPSGVTTLTGGQYHNCAIVAGSVYCWGYNYQGQVGDASISNRLSPVAVRGLGAAVVDVATGSNHSCALLDNGEVRCWGENNYGQLGDGSRETHPVPIPVALRKK